MSINPCVLAADYSYEYNAEFSGTQILIFVVIGLLLQAFMYWKVFEKAGHPGWAALVPIYNIIVLLWVAKRPTWWIVLMLIPFVNFIILIIVCIDIAKNFGKGTGFGVGLLFLGFIFFPILGWGSAQYQGGARAA